MSLDKLRAQAEALGIKVDKRWGESRLVEEIEAVEPPVGDVSDEHIEVLEEVSVVEEVVDVATQPKDTDAMNAYALRLWDNISKEIPRLERISKVKIGLEGQGWTDFSGLILPDA